MTFERGGAMELTPTFYKILPLLAYIGAIISSLGAGFLLYAGLTTPSEQIQTRLRLKRSIKGNKEQFVSIVLESKLEDRLKKAGHPFYLTAIRLHFVRWGIFLALGLNYIIVPLSLDNNYSLYSVLGILVFFIISMPEFRYSIVNIVINKSIELRKAKLNSEIFMLHDLLIGEIEMMSVTRVNTYNIIRHLTPYFKEIRPSLVRLLSQWNEQSPEVAFKTFAEDIDTNEVSSLVTVLKELDQNKRETALKALQGMGDLFIRKQIENYRRKRKLLVDIFSIPIKVAVFLTILNFIMIVVYMVSNIFGKTHF